MLRLLIAVASLLAEHGIVGMWVSVAVVHRFQQLVAPWHMDSSQTGNRTCILCIVRWILKKKNCRNLSKIYLFLIEE